MQVVYAIYRSARPFLKMAAFARKRGRYAFLSVSICSCHVIFSRFLFLLSIRVSVLLLNNPDLETTATDFSRDKMTSCQFETSTDRL